MGKIISFSGRIGSGKSVLASICEKAGYEKLYFALPLKQLIAKLINVNLEDINKLKNVEKEYKFNDIDYIFLANETHIPYETVRDEMSSIEFKTVRQLLQFIGTDLIRKYNENWHVDKIRHMIDPDKNYVIDDTRFKNELNLIRYLGGDAWFIVRPTINNISNHESETSLTWKDFCGNVIINDSSLEMFMFKWETFLSHYDKSMQQREKYMNSECIKKLYKDIVEPVSVFDLLEISNYLYEYKEIYFDCQKIDYATQNEDNLVTVHYKDGTNEIIKNPLNIEELKFCL